MADASNRANGPKIRAARKAKGWSQEDLARESGYSVSWIQKLEQGTDFSHRCLECCAEALGVAVIELLLPFETRLSESDASVASPNQIATHPNAILDGQWYIDTTFEDVGHEEFDVEITSNGQLVTARATCRTGHDKGHVYVVSGIFSNLILRATWSCSDLSRIEAGTVCLLLIDNGNVLEGYNTYYHSKTRVLAVTPQTWRRVGQQRHAEPNAAPARPACRLS
jgi:transcriptional regulator with XRE-family HTH domain